VSDGGPARTEGRITVAVLPVNDPPVAAAGELTVRRSAKLPLTGSDVEENPLRFEIVTAPRHGTTRSEAGELVYVPEGDFAGDDEIAYSASDGQASSEPATIRLHVIANAAPVATQDTITATAPWRGSASRVTATRPTHSAGTR